MTEGQSVTLSCSWVGGNLHSNFSFYKNGKLLRSDVRWKLEISAVSKSDEGFYKCEHSGFFSPESWMSVKCECDQYEVEMESPGWEVDSKHFYSLFSLRRLLNTRSTWSIHLWNFFTYFYSWKLVYTHIKIFLQGQNLFTNLFLLHVKMSAEVLVLHFSTSWICLCSSLLLVWSC